MSKFPSFDTYKTTCSTSHLKHLPENSCFPFILKKAKEVYLYDIDGNKYVDFSLNNGTIIQHSPPKLNKLIKNALSLGLNSSKFYNKFLYKAQKQWQSISQHRHISFYSSFTEMLLSFCAVSFAPHSNIRIGYTNQYLYSLLQPLAHFITLKYIEKDNDITGIDLLITEDFPYSHQQNSLLPIPTIKVHSRSLFRNTYSHSVNDLYFNFFTSSLFGGKEIGVLTGNTKIKYNSPNFDHSILFLEGAKLFSYLQKLPALEFKHPYMDTYQGFCTCSQILEQDFFIKRGIYLQGNTIYFSPYHSKFDLKRLSKVLDEYFYSKLNR